MSILDEVVERLKSRVKANRNGRVKDGSRRFALLRGLSRSSQDKLAREIFGNIEKKAVEVFGNVASDAPIGFGSLFDKYKNMPEPIGDSFLLTSENTPVHFGVKSPNGGPGYSQRNGNVYEPNNMLDELLHELGHATMHRLNPRFPNTRIIPIENPKDNNRYVNGYVYDPAVEHGLGILLADDMKDKLSYGERQVDSHRVFKDVYDFLPDYVKKDRILSKALHGMLSTHAHLDPKNKVVVPTGQKYYDERYRKGVGALYGRFPGERRDYSAASQEDAANAFVVLGANGGDEELKRIAPSFYGQLLRMSEEDHRKGRFIPPEQYWDVDFR